MAGPYRISRADNKRVSRAGNGDINAYLDRLMKMIPGEVVGLYLVGSGLIPKEGAVVLVIWSIVCLIAVVSIKAYGTIDVESNKGPDWAHVAISSVAFVIWVYTLGGPFALFNIAVPYIASLLLLAWTFFVPIFYKGD